MRTFELVGDLIVPARVTAKGATIEEAIRAAAAGEFVVETMDPPCGFTFAARWTAPPSKGRRERRGRKVA